MYLKYIIATIKIKSIIKRINCLRITRIYRLRVIKYVKYQVVKSKESFPSSILKSLLKNTTFKSQLIYKPISQRSKELLHSLLVINNRKHFIKRVKRFIDAAYWIQKGMKIRISLKQAKLEALYYKWDRVLEELLRLEHKNEQMNEMILKIPLIREEIREAALRFYLSRCYTQYFITFMKWIIRKRNDFYEQKKINQLIKERITNQNDSVAIFQKEINIKTNNLPK